MGISIKGSLGNVLSNTQEGEWHRATRAEQCLGLIDEENDTPEATAVVGDPALAIHNLLSPKP